MKRDPLLYGVIGALIGGVVVWFLASSAVNNNMTGMTRMMGMRQNQPTQNQPGEMMQDMMEHKQGMSMDSMVGELKGKTGDDFDKAFVNLMIEHHQGAIDMANEAKVNAKHQEIKDLADNIISAQTKEIEMMHQWQKTWGY
jgi:uncharacterized protein (DUF305 family)